MKRSKFIKKGILSTIGFGFLSGLYAWQIEPFWLEFVKVKMVVKNLPENLNGKKLIQISDLHVGDRFDYNYLIKSFKKAQKLNPDFVVYTGDYISYNKEQFRKLKTVMKSAVIGKYGTVGVLGNHDYGKKWSQDNVANEIIKILKEAGVTILRNEKVNKEGINFIGIDDFWGTNFFPEKALSNLDIEKANIVLCHNPDVCDLNIWGNYNSWILSGHTHGGQVKPPFLPPFLLPVENKKYTSGIINLSNDRMLYINRALGNLWQIRFNVRPEITVFELNRPL